MSSDISLQPESEFTSDMVKAVENIAVNVKLGSAEFSSSIDSLSKAIDGLKSSLIDSINSLKSSASNVAPSSPSATPRAAQGRSPSAQDPSVAKNKEDIKKAKLDLAALKLKTAQEKANFNQEQLLLKIKNSNEVKSSNRKKKDADSQQQTIEDVFKNVGDGFGAVFSVTKEQMAGMSKSGKKGGKEKPFEMDMGALATANKQVGPGVDLPKSFIIAAADASSAWNNVFNEIRVQTEQYRSNQVDISSLIADISSMLGDATDQAQALSSEMASALDPRSYLQQAQDALNSLIPPDVNEFEQLFNDLGNMFNNVEIDSGFNESVIDLSSANDLAESSIRSLIDSVLNLTTASGLGSDVAEGVLEGSQDAANIIGDTFRRELRQFAGTAPGETNQLIEDLSKEATDLAVSFGLLMEGIHSGDTNIAGFSDVLDFAVSSVSRLIEAMDQVSDQKGENFVGPNQLVGPTQEGKAEYDAKKQKQDRENQLKQEDASIRKGVDSFSVLFEAMFGKMGKSVQNVIATTLSGINQSFSDKSPILDAVKSMFGASPVGGGAEGESKGEPKGESKGKHLASTFDFEAMDATGTEVKDTVDAATEEEAEARVRQMGLYVTKLTQQTKKGTNANKSGGLAGIFDSIFSSIGSMFGGGESSPKPQKLSSGGTVGYFAEGTKPKSGMGGIFEGIGSVFGNMFGGKKKKKKKKSLFNNDENNWDTDTNYENKYKNYRADGSEIDDKDTPFKPKGTDTVPAMLTPGEEVVKKSAAKKPENKAAIDAMNKSGGGTVGYFAGGTPGGGIVGGIASLALGPVGAAFSILTGGVKAASDAIAMFGGFVAKANPAIMAQVGLAMNDLQGVIGRALVPAVQTLLPVIRYLGDGMDFVMKMLMPAITPIANAFKTLAMPLIELESVVAQFLAPAFEIVAVAVEGFAIMLDPVIQLLAEIVESFTQLVDSFLGGIPITKLMKDGFEILGQVMKMLVGAIVTVLGLFMSGMGVILQLAGLLISGFGSMVKGIGDLLSYIPGMGTIGAALSAAGDAVKDAGGAIVKSGEDLQKKGEEQRDRGVAKVVEGGQNIAGKFDDPNYKMKDETRYKPGDVTGKGIVKGSSMGAAVRETQSTSISGVGDEVRKQALMAGTGAKTQEESLKDIADKLSKDNLRDAFKEGMIAANGADKGNAGIKGKDPFAGAGHSKPSLAPV